MLTHRGFTAWIQVEGKVLPEYLVAVDEHAHRVSCWIAGQEGQAFTIYWQDEGGTIDTCAFITLDGLVVPGQFLFGNGVTSKGGVRTSLSTERPFIFQRVEENASSKNSSPTTSISKEAGMIILKIKRVRRMAKDKPANRIEPAPKTILGKRKPGDLCIGFGEEVRALEQEDTTYRVLNYDNPELKKPSTYVSFVFRYRSTEFLESQGIVVDEPRPPVTPNISVPATPRSRVASRRISTSLPPVVRPTMAEESEESSAELSDSESELGSPMKKPKLETSLEALFPAPESLFPERTLPFPTDSRRPSAELRRAASWTTTVPVPSKDGVYRGDGQFFLPRLNRDLAARVGLPHLSEFQDMIGPPVQHIGRRVVSKSKTPHQQNQYSQGSSSSNSTESNPESPTTDPDDSFTLSK
ncbi:hypothetical protein CVT25_006508 [Psilocybe cyanescens]|uniref:DUF7918 domain-containing protein n=1 Tax=Psilocybe cyanescens TaxID=93625 RepID=A0A409XEE3_PSICY|nr:hypothetical protein CVT25_006508 [Psilocybe cyanescens]